MLRDHGRFPYSAIVNRPDFSWPGGRRLAVYVALNLEHFAYGEGLGLSYSPGIPHPNTYNWAWREYGNRVGVWRLLELFDRLELPISLLLNSAVYDHCPEVVAAFRRARRRGARPRADQLRAPERLRRGGRGGTHPRGDGGDHPLRGPAATRLAEPGRQPERRHARPPPGGRLHLHPRLADGRSAGLDEDAAGPHPERAVPARGQRHPDDRRSPRDRAGVRRHDRRQLRRDAGAVRGRSPWSSASRSHAFLVGQPFRLRHLRRALEHVARHRAEIWLATTGQIAQHFAEHAPIEPRPGGRR